MTRFEAAFSFSTILTLEAFIVLALAAKGAVKVWHRVQRRRGR